MSKDDRIRAGEDLTETPLFVSGEGGYHTYRIPALIVAPDGTVLAICEGRRHSRSDTGEINILLRRSTDAGRTWGEVQLVTEDGPNAIDNPCPVVDEDTGVVWLLLTHNLGHDGEKGIIEGTSDGTRTAWVTYSEDNGATWSERVDITDDVKAPEWTWYATGPGVGIQLTSGRLVVPCDDSVTETKESFSHVIFSDDHGTSWQYGAATLSGPGTNECQVTERRDGSLLLNIRQHPSLRRRRAITTSMDAGLTWSQVVDEPALVDRGCQASMIRYDDLRAGDPGDRLLYANPASFEARVNMTVRLSLDDGKTWSASRVLHAGPSAYSSLARLPDDAVGCFYERGDDGPYETLTFAKFPIEWLDADDGDRG